MGNLQLTYINYLIYLAYSSRSQAETYFINWKQLEVRMHPQCNVFGLTRPEYNQYHTSFWIDTAEYTKKICTMLNTRVGVYGLQQ